MSILETEQQRLINRFHAQKPIRSWSMIISIFGDCVAPRGGELWMGNITEIMQMIGVNSGVVRTAMSRLASDGWLERTRIGRNSFYRLTKMGCEAFDQATPRIYARGPARGDANWITAILSEGEGRSERREYLTDQGFGILAPNVLIKPDIGQQLPRSSDKIVFMQSMAPPEKAVQLARQAWNLEGLQQGYREFIETYSDLQALLECEGHAPIAPETALIIRVILIHDLRRLVLRDPELPLQALPEKWAGSVARELAAGIYNTLRDHGEIWLDSNARTTAGALPPPEPAFFERFQPL
ncbi:Transcriptional repressor PaaX [Pseudovibrio sp. Ad46]|uniref:PaaX family transcriptional regulator C-terminal domain-containing protein n=1 Tax=Pseudovibrio sp. Ad46 TaxID=989432 RepID=UPI0007B1C96D|nr:PaaX family transcriptional regulator C-terminal domain-containing protein [Pseudovibrio sp. Ad46]KZK91643.1 Transcriptional repressor PaaX [Pseudovibrio sp. Ad46]